MKTLPLTIEKTIREANISNHAAQEIVAILHGIKQEIPPYRATRLIRLLDSLKSGRFTHFAKVKKKELLGNFFDLVNYGHEKTVSRICYLFFTESVPLEETAYLLPPEMIATLVMAGNSEPFDSIKEGIWSFLIRKLSHVERFVSPDELIFGLWAKTPIIRNNIIKFLFTKYSPDAVVEATMRYVSKTGKTIPVFAARRIIECTKEATECKQRENVLTKLLDISNLSVEEINGVWSDYLKGKSRFELIRIFSSSGSIVNEIESLMESHLQLSFHFSPQKNTSDRTASFRNRVAGITAMNVL